MCQWCGLEFVDGEDAYEAYGVVVCRECYLTGYVADQVH